MSNSVQPHRRQPTRLPHPWDSPGKNTGVGCHFLLQCRKVKSESEVTQSCPTLSDPMDCSTPGSSIHGIFQARVLEWGAIAFSYLSSLDFSKEQFTYFGSTAFALAVTSFWNVFHGAGCCSSRVSNLMTLLQTSFSCFPVLLPSRHMEGLSFLDSLGLGTAMGAGLSR